MEAAGAARGGAEVVAGAGLWGWGGVEEGLVGTAQASARCGLCSGDCGLLACSKPLTLAVGEAGGQLRLSRTTREFVGTCGCCDGVTSLKRADRGGIALST